MKQIIQAIQHPIRSSLFISGSKSITNRALLLAVLAEGVSEISNILMSDDTQALLEALHELGVMYQLDRKNKVCLVNGCAGKFPCAKANIWCHSAATVARFLLAACASSSGTYYFDASEQLKNRPLSALIKILSMQGAKIFPPDQMTMPLTIEGVDGLQGGEIEIDASETGQFVSALLMVAPFAKFPVVIKAHQLVSRPYVKMTCEMMAEFGVRVRSMPQSRYSIPVPQRYLAKDYVVEPDLSTASYFFAAAAVTGGEITIQSVDRKLSKQGDIKFLAVLEKMGCQVIENPQGLTVKGPAELKGVSVDMRDCSDTFMTLAAIAPFAKTPTSITNIGHTRLQESDRISAMRSELEKLAVKVEEGPDWLKIYPSVPKTGVVDAHNDHRIAMALAIMGLRVGIEIIGAECVTKTCPDFFDLWEAMTSS